LSVVECCVLSGRGLCDELITRPEESYRLWSVVVCDLENLKNEEAVNRVGSQRHKKKKKKRLVYSVGIMIGRLFNDAVLPANFSCIKLYAKVVVNGNVGFQRVGRDLLRV